jgi:hypothetical protein
MGLFLHKMFIVSYKYQHSEPKSIVSLNIYILKTGY